MNSAGGPGTTPEAAVRQTILESALAGERLLSVARIVVCLASGIRSGWIWFGTPLAEGHEVARAAIAFPSLALAIGFSIAVLCGLGRRRNTSLVLHLSVSIDAVVIFLGLLPNVMWPASAHQGLPVMIDTALLPTLAVAAGLRLSTSAALLSGALHTVSYGTLVVIDDAVSGDRLPTLLPYYSAYAILIAAAIALAVLIASRTRALAERGARAAVAAERAGKGLREVLRDHHDLRTVITSAQINADLLARGAADGESLAATVANLRDDLGEIRAQLEQVKGRALEELAGVSDPCPAAVADAARAVVAALAPRFPGVSIHVEADDRAAAMVAGGDSTLRRILANLLVNACEGDGRRGASRVDLRARAGADGRIAVEVVDDGPGLPAHVLTEPRGQAASTKPTGSGVGIGLVDGLVRASGGTVSWGNRDGGGARILVELPEAP